jgi:hypothetical protein
MGGSALKFRISQHANGRSQERMLPPFSVELAAYFGEVRNVRNAQKLVVTEDGVSRAASMGIDLRMYSGIHIVCNAGTVITEYQKCGYRVLAAAA